MTPSAGDASGPRPGEIWWVALDPSVDGEIQKTRPAIIVSNDAANRVLNRLQVVPVSSRTAKLYPAEAAVNVDGRPAKAMADQLTTISLHRLRGRLGRIDAEEMVGVERVMRLQLGL